MNLLLLRAGYPPVVILPEDRVAYFDALDAARTDDRESYYQFLSVRLEAVLDRYLDVMRRGLDQPSPTA